MWAAMKLVAQVADVPQLNGLLLGGGFTFLILMFGFCLKMMVNTQSREDKMKDHMQKENDRLRSDLTAAYQERDRYRDLWLECTRGVNQ